MYVNVKNIQINRPFRLNIQIIFTFQYLSSVTFCLSAVSLRIAKLQDVLYYNKEQKLI